MSVNEVYHYKRKTQAQDVLKQGVENIWMETITHSEDFVAEKSRWKDKRLRRSKFYI